MIPQIAATGRIMVMTSSDHNEFRGHRVTASFRDTPVGEVPGSETGEHRLLAAINTGRTYMRGA